MGVSGRAALGRISGVRLPFKPYFTAERCAIYAFAIGALMFGASAIEDFACLRARSAGQTCGFLPASLFYVGITLAVLLLAGSLVLWLITARSTQAKSND